MAEKPYRWTVDVEYDWGGRTNGIAGLTIGIPRILEAFKEAKIKALFFISTETLESVPDLIHQIRSEGHEIGSHGHFHIRFKEHWRAERDKKICEDWLIQRSFWTDNRLYRAPKFYWNRKNSIYSDPKNHVSLLKHMWLRQPIREETIIYLHPFDLAGHDSLAPNLFCKLWYCRPWDAYILFREMVNKYK